MSERIPTQPPQDRSQQISMGHAEPQPQAEQGRMSVVDAGRALLDRYTPKTLNAIIQNLKSLMTNRAGRSYEVSAQREHQSPEVDTKDIKKSVLDKQAMQEQLAKGKGEKSTLSTFEKVFLAHFEGGLLLGEEPLPEGQQKYAMKTEEQHQKFFTKAAPKAQDKKVPVMEIQEARYRGMYDLQMQNGQKLPVAAANNQSAQQLLQEKAAQAEQGTLVSDLKLANGKTEKFTQTEIKEKTLLQQLAKLMPGDVVGQSLLAQVAGGSDLAYLAITHKVVRPEFLADVAKALGKTKEELRADLEGDLRQRGDTDKMSDALRGAGRGMILSSRAEQMAAQALDLNWRGPAAAPVKVGGREPQPGGGLFSGLLGMFRKKKRGGGGYDTEIVPGFVPWYQLVWQKRNWKQQPKWFVILTYFVTFSAVALFLYFVFKFLLQQQ